MQQDPKAPQDPQAVQVHKDQLDPLALRGLLEQPDLPDQQVLQEHRDLLVQLVRPVPLEQRDPQGLQDR